MKQEKKEGKDRDNRKKIILKELKSPVHSRVGKHVFLWQQLLNHPSLGIYHHNKNRFVLSTHIGLKVNGGHKCDSEDWEIPNS